MTRLRVTDMNVTWAPGLPAYFKEAVAVEDFKDLLISNFRGRSAQTGVAAIRLTRGENASVRFSKETSGQGKGLVHQDVRGKLALDSV